MFRKQLFGVVSVSLVLVAGLVGPSVAGEDMVFPDNTIAVGLAASATPNTDVTVELSRATFDDDSVQEVLIGRADVFADSLASGVLQSDGPLLLVPTNGPVPENVRTEIVRLGAGTATILGGEAAVSAGVVTELEGMGLTTDRLSGVTRIETAIAVAQQRTPTATTALLARAGGIEGNPTSGFADALAAGGWAAATEWPVLLTQTDELTASTREFLAASSITAVNIVGGTAAVGQAVQTALEDMNIAVTRVSGPDRAATAVEIAKARGLDDAADANRVIVVDGFGDDAWAAGFASAAQAAGGASDQGLRVREGQQAPILLGNAQDLPPATVEYLTPGPTAITCAVSAAVCDSARMEIGFAPAVRVEVPPGSVVYTVDGPADDDSLIYAGQFDGTVLGLAHPCVDVFPEEGVQLTRQCTEIDFDDTGTYLAVFNSNGTPFSVLGLTLGEPTAVARPSNGLPEGLAYTSINAFTRPDGRNHVRHVRSDGSINSRGANGLNDTFAANCDCARFAGFQAVIAPPPPVSPSPEDISLVIGLNGDLVAHPARANVNGVQRRPGSEVLGAAFSPASDLRIAIVDAIGGQGLLRIDNRDDSIIEVDGVDANSTPYWGAADSGIAVLADTADGVSLVVVDPATGTAETVVDDAGDAAGGRISGDASGTFFAWRTATDIRILDTRDGTVATINPPSGLAITGGPTFRP